MPDLKVKERPVPEGVQKFFDQIGKFLAGNLNSNVLDEQARDKKQPPPAKPMKYGFEIKVGVHWVAANPPSGPPPYSFDTEIEAETMAKVLHPVLVRLMKEGNKDLIRIVSVEDP